MQPTKLLYLEDFTLLESPSRVLDIAEENGKTVLILDQTVFYPQGGGQPFDTGIITGNDGSFTVEEVRFSDGFVKHIGEFTGKDFQISETVHCFVEQRRRSINSRIHSAGHVIDMAVHALKLNWIPGKGYHFPDGPYVEYSGTFNAEHKENVQKDIERIANEFVQEGRKTSILFMEKEKMHEVCHFVPDYLPSNKPSRVVMYGDFGVPCGGTHVSNLGEIGKIIVRKIKMKGDVIRVSYAV
ncbi:MAG TPA: alanine--tRNA ligase-related protein [Candidatus Andersenbacteria bacterium]|nr:alanine--tRNA ligase-related protein [Candidatus Andersenbacteria bacterium]